MNTTNERIITIEMKLAFQEKTIEDLGSRLYEHQLLIEKMSAQLKIMKDRMKDYSDGNPVGSSGPYSVQERPPHY